MKAKRKDSAAELIMRALEYLDAAETMTKTFADDADKIFGLQLGVSGAKWYIEQLQEVLG